MHWQDSTTGAVSMAITGLPGIFCLSVFSVAIAFSQSSETHGFSGGHSLEALTIIARTELQLNACSSDDPRSA
jgi:hypothetical protein